MHPITYEVKRAHWRSTWEAIELFRDAADRLGERTLAEMTPARYDVLQTIWDFKAEERAIREQHSGVWEERCAPLAWIRECLGLAGSTIWKIVYKLEELRWVDVIPHPDRARWKLVVMTDLGVHALRMGQECAQEISVDERGRPHRGFHHRVEDLVRRDVVEQGALPSADAVVAEADAVRRTALGRERPIRTLRDYFWWLVDRARGIAKFFGCKALRLYPPTAYRQVVTVYDDVVSRNDPPYDSSGQLPAVDDLCDEESTDEPPINRGFES